MLSRDDKKKTPLYVDVSRRISAMITAGELHHGDKLPPERELAETFGVSRTSVREAIRMLSRNCLLRSRRGSGTYVNSEAAAPALSGGALPAQVQYSEDDLHEFREMVECYIVGLVAQRATEEDINALKSIMYDQQRAIDLGMDETAYIKNFHLELAKITRNPLLLAVMRSLNDMLEQRRNESGKHFPPQRRQSRLWHHKIIIALEKHSVEESRQAMREHIQNNRGEGLSE